MKIIKKADIIYISSLIVTLVIASFFMLKSLSTQQNNSVNVVVEVYGNLYGTYPLNQDIIIDIGGVNTLEIKDNDAKMISAKCPDQLCIHQASITNNLRMIVCLPNQVLITLDGEIDTELDAVS